MFKQKMNPAAMLKAQEQMEAAMNEFEKQTFQAIFNGTKVTLLGTRIVQSVSCDNDSGSVDIADFMTAYQSVSADMEHQRNVHLVRIRNNIMKSHKVDIKSMVPDIAAAVAYMDSRS
jgi:hypothetical protein